MLKCNSYKLGTFPETVSKFVTRVIIVFYSWVSHDLRTLASLPFIGQPDLANHRCCTKMFKGFEGKLFILYDYRFTL